MDDLGYASHNALLVLGSVSIFVFIWIVKVVFYSFWHLMWKTFHCKFKYYDELKASLFWGEIISIILETFIEIVVASYLNL
jgi:hypothetical protein